MSEKLRDWEDVGLGRGILVLRKYRGLYQRELAERAGIRTENISLYETGARAPSKATLEKIAEALDVPISVLVWYSLTPDMVAEEKRDAFMLLRAPIEELIKQHWL